MKPFTLPGPRVLLATADRGLKIRFARTLANLNVIPQFANNAPEAIKILLGPNSPEIALLDSALSEPSGLDLAIEIKRRISLKRTWVILLSRAADSVSIAAAAEAGVNDLLLYPTHDPADESCAPQQAESALESNLRICLAVATRVQELGCQLDAEVRSSSFNLSRDHLTGLWNRESLLSLLFPETDRVQRMGTPLAVFLIDIDRFAAINDAYGYCVGDNILQEFANRLRRHKRSYDLIGRCDGDDFLIALPGCNSVHAVHLAARIRTVLLRRPFQASDDLIYLTASIGVAYSRGRSPLVVLREAECALAAAKRDSGNCEREYRPAASSTSTEENAKDSRMAS